MRKEITTRNRGDFFVVLFGIVRFFDILREYRAAAGVDVRLFFHSDGLRDIFSDGGVEKFGKFRYFYYFCINEMR